MTWGQHWGASHAQAGDMAANPKCTHSAHLPLLHYGHRPKLLSPAEVVRSPPLATPGLSVCDGPGLLDHAHQHSGCSPHLIKPCCPSSPTATAPGISLKGSVHSRGAAPSKSTPSPPRQEPTALTVSRPCPSTSAAREKHALPESLSTSLATPPADPGAPGLRYGQRLLSPHPGYPVWCPALRPSTHLQPQPVPRSPDGSSAHVLQE